MPGIYAHLSICVKYRLDAQAIQDTAHEGYAKAGEVVRADSSWTAEVQAIGLAVKMLFEARHDTQEHIRTCGDHHGPPSEVIVYNDNQEAVAQWKTCKRQQLDLLGEYDVQWMSREDPWFAKFAHAGSRSMRPPRNFLYFGAAEQVHPVSMAHESELLSLETMD